MNEYLILFFIALITGFSSSQIARALDFAMDFGHYLDWLRLSMVKKAAIKTGRLKDFESDFEKRLKIIDFGERIDAMDQLYWNVANAYKPLVLWLCFVCISHRINFLLSAVFIGCYWFLLGFNPLLIGFYIISFSINQYFIK